MRLLNLNIDNLHLMGQYAGDMFEKFELILGYTDNNTPKRISNRIFIANSDMSPWNGAIEQNHLTSNRFELRKVRGEVAHFILDGKRCDLGDFNLIFSGVYSPDCSTLYPVFKIGFKDKDLKRAELIAYGIVPVNEGRDVYPNLAIYAPPTCEYSINGVLYSGADGRAIQKSKCNIWLTPVEFLMWYMDRYLKRDRVGFKK